MLSMTEARERVTRGATYLDTARPGWHDRIDVGTLTLHDPCGCIVGQLCGRTTFSNFATHARVLFDLPAGSVFTAQNYGVDITMGDGLPGFQMLQDAWIEAIAARRCPVEETTDADVSTSDVRVGQR